MSGAYSRFPLRNGKDGSYRAADVPLALLNNLARNTAIPITITTAGVVTVAASATEPVPLWNGNDFILLRESLAYTWADAATNKILTTATGAETTGSPTAAVYYYYVGLSTAGVLEIYASVDAPSFIQRRYEGPILGHPGTATTRFWNYVGWSAVNTTAGLHLAASKHGFWYDIANASIAAVTTSAWGIANFAARIPGHAVEVAGTLVTSELSQTVFVGSSTVGSTVGALEFKSGSLAAIAVEAPFCGVVPTTTGGIYCYQTPTSGAAFIRITRVRDLV